VDALHAIVFSNHPDLARPERRPLRQFAFDADEIGGIGLDEERPVDQHHVLAARPHVHPDQPSRLGADAEKFVVGRRQGRLRLVRRRLHGHLLGFERRKQHFPLNQRRPFHRGDLEAEAVDRIERRPRLDRRLHPAAPG